MTSRTAATIRRIWMIPPAILKMKPSSQSTRRAPMINFSIIIFLSFHGRIQIPFDASA
jgi:hypothetical protein